MSEKETINPINDEDKFCLKQNHRDTGKRSQRLLKSKPFISKYNWKKTSYPPEKDD